MRTVVVVWDPVAERFTATGTHAPFAIDVNAPSLDPGQPATGFSPTELLLAGVGACAAWDVIEIMRKRRKPVTGLQVQVEGTQAKAAPHAYERIGLHFTVSGRDLDHAQLQRTLRLSLERYCSVLATIRPDTQIEETIEIVDQPSAEQAERALTA